MNVGGTMRNKKKRIKWSKKVKYILSFRKPSFLTEGLL